MKASVFVSRAIATAFRKTAVAPGDPSESTHQSPMVSRPVEAGGAELLQKGTGVSVFRSKGRTPVVSIGAFVSNGGTLTPAGVPVGFVVAEGRWYRFARLLVGVVGLLLLAVNPSAGLAMQTGTVAGSVLQTGTTRPVVGAVVWVHRVNGKVVSERMSVSTATDGTYSLSNVPVGTIEIGYRAIGYSTRSAIVTLVMGAEITSNVELPRTTINLDEIVVTGSGGEVQKKQLGNTVATIDAEELQWAPVSSFSELIQAREPGVVGLPSSGLVGDGARIRIRGSNSLSMSNEPLVYVDGVRVDNAGGLGGGRIYSGGGANPSRLDDINWEAVERIEVIKGPAAATLYGSEASSGVIQIFTKRGSVGRPRFNLRVELGGSQYPNSVKPNVGFARDSAQAAGLSEMYRMDVQPFQLVERTFTKDMYETGVHQSYSLDLTGGSQDIQYYVSGRFASEDGPWGGRVLGPATDGVRRFQTNGSLTMFPRDRLSFRITANYANTQNDVILNNNNVFGATTNAMFSKPELAHCNGSSVDPSATLGETTPMCTGVGNATGAPLSSMRETMQPETDGGVDRFGGMVSLNYDASSTIDLDVKVGIDVVNERGSQFFPLGWNVDNVSRFFPDGVRRISTRSQREITLEGNFRWKERFGAVSSYLVVGGQSFISDAWWTNAAGFGFSARGLEVAGAGAEQFIEEGFLSSALVGGYVQEQIGFRDFAYLTVGGRFDRASAFGGDAAPAFYPKASASVILSDLSGWNSSLVSTLRLRAAVGESGLQPGVFDQQTTYSAAVASTGSGIAPENLGNPALFPERSLEYEVGGEIGLLRNRLSFDVTYWDRTTRNALVERAFPAAGGFLNRQLDNIGRLDGRGWEFKVDALVIDAAALSVDLFANASHLNEVVVDLGNAPPLKVGGTYPRYRNTLIEGYAPGSHFGAQLIPVCGGGIQRTCYTPGATVPFDSNDDGLPDTVGEYQSYLTANPSISVTDAGLRPILDDEDGDGDPLDHFLGKPTPDWQGAFGAGLTFWRNLHVNTVFEYRAGNFGVSNLTDAFRRAQFRNTTKIAAVEAALENPATQSDPDARLQAAMLWATELSSLAPASGLNLIEKGDFIRWRELGITYVFPRSFAGRIGLDNLAITGSVRNLALWTGYSGTDPEVNAISRCNGDSQFINGLNCNFLDSVDMGAPPLARRFTLAVRVGF